MIKRQAKYKLRTFMPQGGFRDSELTSDRRSLLQIIRQNQGFRYQIIAVYLDGTEKINYSNK